MWDKLHAAVAQAGAAGTPGRGRRLQHVAALESPLLSAADEEEVASPLSPSSRRHNEAKEFVAEKLPARLQKKLVKKATEARFRVSQRYMSKDERHKSMFWIVLVLTAVLSSLVSFIIDQGTQNIGTWRQGFTTFSHGYSDLGMICIFNIMLTCGARLLVRTKVEAEGSGFPEVKAMLFGKPMRNFLTLRVLAIKAVCLTMGVGAGLPLGKEGPNVHMAACISHTLSDLMGRWGLMDKDFFVKKRVAASHLLLAACAVGVGSSFSAPIGGVVFALELVLPQVFDSVGYSGCFLSAVSGSVCYILYRSAFADASVLMPLLSTNVGPGEGAQSRYPFFLLLMDVLLGVICGYTGAYWISSHKKCAKMFKEWRLQTAKAYKFKHGSLLADHILEDSPSAKVKGAVTRFKFNVRTGIYNQLEKREWRDLAQIAVITLVNTIVAANLPLLGGKPQPALLSTLFNKELMTDESWVLWWAGPVATMFLCFLAKWFLTMMALSLPNPAGVVAPVMIIGGLLGRFLIMLVPSVFLDILLGSTEDTVSDAERIALRGALVARFAIIGAGAFSSAVCRAFAMAITIFEVLALPNLIIPISTASLAAMFVADKFARPYFDTNLIGRGLQGISDLTHGKEAFKPAFEKMRRVDLLSGCLEKKTSLMEIEQVLSEPCNQDEEFFAIVEHVNSGSWQDTGVSCMLKGCITRKNLEDIKTDVSSKGHGASMLIDLMSPQYAFVQRGSSAPPRVNLTPLHVTEDTIVQDVYLVMKVANEPVVFVTKDNLLQGIITLKELLGHSLEKGGGRGWDDPSNNPLNSTM